MYLVCTIHLENDWHFMIMKRLSYDEMVRAMLTDDVRYDGKFYVCVKSTRIYCLPSCKAKQPMLKNVVFFPTRETATAAGFRGCKRCRAEFFPDVAPRWLDAEGCPK